MKNNIAFGEDGWYGIAGEDFTEENIVRLMHAFVRYLSSKSSSLKKVTIAVGYDGRQDSKNVASLASEILAHNGIAVLLSSNVLPTPVLSFATKHLGCAAGIMITGCHYSSGYNGVQFKGAYGGPLLPAELRKIEKLLLESKEKMTDPAGPSHGSATAFDFLPDYISHLKTIVDVSLLRSFAQDPKNSANVLIDSMGGAGQTIIEDILVGCGWRAQTLFSEPEAHFFDRRPQPVPRNIEPLMYNVSVVDAQFGIATDGDAEGCGIIYPDGKWMDSQETVLALLWHLCVQKKLRGGVVKTASVTDKVAHLIKAWDGRLLDVGLRGVTEDLLQEWNAFGVDRDGRFSYKHHLLESDGILSGLLFAEMIAMSGEPLHKIIQNIRNITGEVHCDSVDIPYTPKIAGIFDKLLTSTPTTFAGKPIENLQTSNKKDVPRSLKFCFGRSNWFLAEISNTGNMLHLFVEGETASNTRFFLYEGENLFNSTHQ